MGIRALVAVWVNYLNAVWGQDCPAQVDWLDQVVAALALLTESIFLLCAVWVYASVILQSEPSKTHLAVAGRPYNLAVDILTQSIPRQMQSLFACHAPKPLLLVLSASVQLPDTLAVRGQGVVWPALQALLTGWKEAPGVDASLVQRVVVVAGFAYVALVGMGRVFLAVGVHARAVDVLEVGTAL